MAFLAKECCPWLRQLIAFLEYTHVMHVHSVSPFICTSVVLHVWSQNIVTDNVHVPIWAFAFHVTENCLSTSEGVEWSMNSLFWMLWSKYYVLIQNQEYTLLPTCMIKLKSANYYYSHGCVKSTYIHSTCTCTYI
jgi:hypothetical protein